MDPRLIAFYLPQFHPIPENDKWWGKGFTEWTNVAKARPLFKGHYQPHLPADLGFYDLRLPEVREQQAEMAREHGIHGFCYYHYWFNGRRLLERPFNEVLASGRPDFPFCLCWANENWTRAWDGYEREVLVRQEYSPDNDVAHIRSLMPAFRDPRHIRVDGRPLFLVYRAGRLPDPKATTDRWRREAEQSGLDGLFLCRVESFADEDGDPRELGFDAAVEFQPRWSMVADLRIRRRKWWHRRSLATWEPAFARHVICAYESLVGRAVGGAEPGYPRIRCVCPSWDNSARRNDNACILCDSTPELYGAWLSQVIEQTAKSPCSVGGEQPLVFINAWNEWAEGNHLEPCQKMGRAYLEATRAAIGRAR